MDIQNNYKKVINLKEDSVLNYNLKEDSIAVIFFYNYSGVATTVNINLDTNSSCELYGIFKNTDEKTDVVTNVVHNGHNSKCNQDFRFINKNSVSSFEGLISVPKDITNCESHMSNKNLLLDTTSKAFAKPELNILNSNVVCSHSSTTGALDEEQLFYLQSRGISYEDSIDMLVEAFSQDIKNKMEGTIEQ